MVRPIFLIYKFFQTKSKVEIWLTENTDLRLEGKIIVRGSNHSQGFDEFMNTVLEDAYEVNLKKNTKKKVGRIMVKGDNVALICNIR